MQLTIYSSIKGGSRGRIVIDIQETLIISRYTCICDDETKDVYVTQMQNFLHLYLLHSELANINEKGTFQLGKAASKVTVNLNIKSNNV